MSGKRQSHMARQYTLKATGIAISVGDALGGGLWKWVDGESKVFTVLSPIRKGSVIARSGITTAPDIMDVRDLETGTDRRILVGKVLMSTLTENFPNDSYVGKSFRATQSAPPPGKRYKGMTVEPVEVEGPSDEKPAKAKK